MVCVITEVPVSQHSKIVYHCQVLGGKGCGKSSFVRGLVGKEMALVPEELQYEEAMSIKALTLPSSTSPIYLLVCMSTFLSVFTKVKGWQCIVITRLSSWGGGGGGQLASKLCVCTKYQPLPRHILSPWWC